ncbi:MAG: tetratricopeptide repeat protein [Candidatus Hodarchaeota archaeon]
MNYAMEQMTVSKRAFNHYQQAMALFEELEEWEGLALCCLKIGIILFNQADYKGALKAYQRGHEAAQQVGTELIRANCLMNIGRVFEQWGEPERAMYYYKTALTHFQQNFDTKGITQCVHNIDVCAAKLKWLPVEHEECANV